MRERERDYFFFEKLVGFRLLYTIFFLTKSAKKVRLLFLRGLEARRGFFGRSGLKFEVSSLSREGSRLPASFLGGLMASLARAPAGPSTHALCLTFPAPFTPSGGVPQRAPGCNFSRPYEDVTLFFFAEQKIIT